MAKMQKLGWYACEDPKVFTMKNEKKFIENKEEKGKKEPTKFSPRMKTLTRATLNEIPLVKVKIKAMLPVLQRNQVRRYKISHYESVILELEEGNLQFAADYIKKLLKLDEDLREKAGAGTIIWRKPWLKNRNDLIDLLRDSLTVANQANKRRELLAEARALLQTALSFESKTWEWWWIAEDLFQSALKTSTIIKVDDEQTDTIVHYLYGKFLHTRKNEVEKALKHLNIAWKKSRHKNWNASKILGTKQKAVFRETSMVLHKTYLDLANKIKNDNTEKAVEAYKEALEKARDSDCEEYVAEALYELGKCDLTAKNTKEALHNFSKYLAMVKRLENPEGICNAHMQLAFSYQQIKDEEDTMKHFRLFKDSAAEFQLPYKLAQAHFFTGEHLLNIGKPELATPHLQFSVSLYSRLNAIKDCDRARCVAGVSKGQEIIQKFVELILDSENINSKTIEKVCKWKNIREPFWNDENSAVENFQEFPGEKENHKSI